MMWTRRGVCGALAASALTPLSAAPRPDRGVLVRNACILTMDPTAGMIAAGSVHVQGGRIVAVGATVAAPGAEVIDGTGMILLPGLIDTHFHTWQTLFRSFGGTTPQTAYFPSLHHFAAGMEPDDMYAATRLAATEALNAGVTTIHDWCHNIRSAEHARQDIRALADAGIRARWSFGQAEDQAPDQTIRLDDLTALAADWGARSNGGLIRLGMAWRGMYRGGAWIPERVYRKELDTARGLGLPITTHTGTLDSSVGHIEKHYRAGLYGPDVNIVHACSATPAEVEMVKASGASVSSLPMTEMIGGWGFPKLYEFMKAGVRTGLGIDTSVLGGSTNLFKLMQFAMASCNVAHHNEMALTARDALELGTIRAASVLGIDDQVGSITAGKRADLILVRTDTLGTAVVADPYALIVESALPEWVDTVMVEGRFVKRGGHMIGGDTARVVEQARRASERVRARMRYT